MLERRGAAGPAASKTARGDRQPGDDAGAPARRGRRCRPARPGWWPRWSRRRGRSPRSSASACRRSARTSRRVEPGRPAACAPAMLAAVQRSCTPPRSGSSAPPRSMRGEQVAAPLVGGVREVLAPVAAAGLLAGSTRRRPARSPRSAGWSPPSSRSSRWRGSLRRARRALPAVSASESAERSTPAPAGHRPLQRRRGSPGSTTQAGRRPARAPARPAPAGHGRCRRRSAGRTPGPPAASCWPAGWRRARRCRRPRRRRTGPGSRCGRAGRCGRRREA